MLAICWMPWPLPAIKVYAHEITTNYIPFDGILEKLLPGFQRSQPAGSSLSRKVNHSKKFQEVPETVQIH